MSYGIALSWDSLPDCSQWRTWNLGEIVRNGECLDITAVRWNGTKVG